MKWTKELQNQISESVFLTYNKMEISKMALYIYILILTRVNKIEILYFPYNIPFIVHFHCITDSIVSALGRFNFMFSLIDIFGEHSKCIIITYFVYLSESSQPISYWDERAAMFNWKFKRMKHEQWKTPK